MTEHYYLFRNHELIFSNVANAVGSLGAGDCHQHGQPGDVLIYARDKHVARGWHWIKPGTPMEMPWKDIPDKDLDHNKYRVLIMLQI